MKTKTVIWLVTAVVAFTLLIFLIGSTEWWGKQYKHLSSGVSGLERRVVLMNCSGDTTKVYEGHFMVEIDSGVVSFIDDNNKEIKVIAPFVIVEEVGK